VKVNKVCLLGGTGFIGRHLCARLSLAGMTLVVPTRHPHRQRALNALSGVSLRESDIFDVSALADAFAGCEAVVNLVGILNQGKGLASFRQIHVELVDRIVEAGRSTGVRRLLHMSALNADEAKGASLYLRTKGEGENRAHTLGGATMAVTSFRPSVVFGPDDSFFNRFATLVRLPGPLPLACPESRLAPVYVGDVAEAFVRSIDSPRTFGNRYELCGPRVLSLREIVQYTARQLGLRKAVIGLPDLAARIQARIFERLPGMPFTYDNYLSLQTDSVCTQDGLGALAIEPTDIDAVVPDFLSRRNSGGRLDRMRRQT